MVFCLATSSAFCRALSWICFCLAGSLAMIEIKSFGTGVDSLKLSANFFSSISLISLSALALLLRAFSAFFRCWVAKSLNEFSTSRSTVEVALGAAAPSLACGEMVRVLTAAGRRGVAAFLLSFGFVSVALASDPLFSGAFASVGFPSAFFSTGFPSGPGVGVGVAAGVAGPLEAGGTGLLDSSDFDPGLLPVLDLMTEVMMAGSTGAPLTVAMPVGARRAGGVYLFSRFASGG